MCLIVQWQSLCMHHRLGKIIPLSKKHFNWLLSHLKHKHKMMNAEDHAVHLKSSKDTNVKHWDVAIFNDYVPNEFDGRALKIEFQDIKDRIVGLNLMTNPSTRSTRHIRENIQMHLIPLYTIVRESLETSMHVTRSQIKSDGVQPDENTWRDQM